MVVAMLNAPCRRTRVVLFGVVRRRLIGYAQRLAPEGAAGTPPASGCCGYGRGLGSRLDRPAASHDAGIAEPAGETGDAKRPGPRG